jgi:tripartite-type tricarboxylate transporter receptor subunit TctC
MRMKSLCLVGAFALLGTILGSAAADEWPTRIVKIVVPYGPGGGVDSFARPIASVLSEQSSHRVIIENRSGAITPERPRSVTLSGAV